VPKKQNPNPCRHRDIIVMGASAGGVEALLRIAGELPRLDASLFVVLHTGRNGFSILPTLLARHSPRLKVEPVQDGLAMLPSHLYVALPDYHLVLEPGYMRLVRGPLENRHRPSIDALFRSAARVYGPRVIGVVLSGYLDDGSAGLHSIKKAGGAAVVQDPGDALVPGMPESAISTTNVDYILSAEEIPALLGRLVDRPIEEEVMKTLPDKSEKKEEAAKKELIDPKGSPSAYTCPECHGTLWEVHDGNLLRYACRVGHSFSIESMIQDQSDAAERAIWAALRALEERRDMSLRMAKSSRTRGLHELANRYSELGDSAANDASVLRRLLLENRPNQSRERSDDLAKSA
jgi:two-component system chemotaxis response regulator CheB